MPSSTSSSDGGRGLRRWLRDLAAFLAVLGLVFAGVEAYVRARLLGEDAGKYEACRRGSGPATIVFGPSTALQGVAPRFLGDDAYNLAMAGANPTYLRTWGELMIRPAFRPRLALVDLPYFWDQTNLGRVIEYDSDLMPPDVFFAAMARPGADWLTALHYRLLTFKYRKALTTLLLGRMVTEGLRYERGWKSQEGSYVGVDPLPPGVTDPRAAGDLAAFLDALAGTGARIVLIQSPSFLPHARDPRPAGRVLAALARRRGLPFLNYNVERRGPLNGDRGAFLDPYHMSRRGAERFSARLAADLRAAGLLGPTDAASDRGSSSRP